MYADGLVAGHLVADPYTFVSNGKEYARATVGVNPIKGKSSFFVLIASDSQKDVLLQYRKGEQIFAFVEPQQRTSTVKDAQWTDPAKVNRSVRVSEVSFFVRKIYDGDFYEVRVRGSLADEPILKETSDGQKKYATFWLELNVKDKKILKRVTAFARVAEALVKFKKAGDPVIVTGYVTQDRYEKDGQTRIAESIVATRVTYIPVPKDELADDLAALMGEDIEVEENHGGEEVVQEPMEEAAPEPPRNNDEGAVENVDVDEALKALFG